MPCRNSLQLGLTGVRHGAAVPYTKTVTDDRYCTNCRAPIARGSSVCAACGTYAGDVFDGKLPKPGGRRAGGGGWVLIVLLLAAGAGAYWWFFMRTAAPRIDTGPVRVVGDRPGSVHRPAGAGINGAEAIVILRHFFASQEHPIRGECLALVAHGYSNGYYSVDAVNSCDRTPLGRFRIDGKTKAVTRSH